jgi:hypothetical protein
MCGLARVGLSLWAWVISLPNLNVIPKPTRTQLPILTANTNTIQNHGKGCKEHGPINTSEVMCRELLKKIESDSKNNANDKLKMGLGFHDDAAVCGIRVLSAPASIGSQVRTENDNVTGGERYWIDLRTSQS